MSETLELRIEGVGARGDGIAHDENGAPVFVPGALAGETVRVGFTDVAGPSGKATRKARLLEVLKPSPNRTPAPCRHFLDCGGCDVQHMDDHAYENWKRGLVAEALARAGVAANVGPLHRVPAASRRRARFFAVRISSGVVLGFQAEGSHRVVDMAECPALDPRLFALTAPLRDFLADELKPGERAEAEAQMVDGSVDLIVRLPGRLDRGLRERLVSFAAGAGVARIGWQGLAKGRRGRADPVEVAAELTPVRAVFGGVAVAVPPLAFLQASRAGERALVAAVMGHIADGAKVADLYAGAGTFTFPLAAKGCAVAAFDGARDLIEALNAAANRAQLGQQVRGSVRDLERRPVPAGDLSAFDACVFDPPRGGAEAQAREIAASTLKSVVAVSCNPASFARDAKILMDAGFDIGPVMPVDQFVWTRHVEVVAAFSRE